MLYDDILTALDEQTSIEDRVYEEETLTEMSAPKVMFDRTVFRKCRLQGNALEGSEFIDVVFEDCDLSNSRFGNAYFKNCVFLRCKMEGSAFGTATFKNVKWDSCGCAYCNFVSSLWESTSMTDCDMKQCFLSEVTFRKPVFHRTDLTGADLYRTKLKGLNLSDCEIGGIMVSETYAELAGLKVSFTQAAELARYLKIQIV